MKTIKKLFLYMLTLSCIFTLIPMKDVNAKSFSTSDFIELELFDESNQDEILLLEDSKGALHAVAYASYDVSDDYYMLGFSYASDRTSNKCNILDIESYKQISNTKVSYDQTTTLDVTGKDLAALIYSIDHKQLTQKYIYLTIGISPSKSSDYFDDAYDIKILNPFYLKSIKLSKNTLALKQNETHTLTLTKSPSKAYSGEITYTSTNPAVAKVDNNGKITALDAGTTTIKVKTSTGKTSECVVNVSTPSFPFYDVNPNTWYRKTIEETYNLGLLTGATDTLFKPNANMNRAMVACVFHRMEGSKKTEWKPLFSDVKSNQYYSSPVTWAKQTGVINGYKDGTFKPTKNVTREEMATMIYNFARYKGLNVNASKDITKFSDYHKITPYARITMQWAVEKGLMSGKDNGTRLDPLGNATRAECSKMLLQAYKLIYK